ncbi:MAG: CGNR zinc finger domain-containing protein [Chloroflexota bacterium]|nr:CGNR zinc finger domain-containing protein [Chloroflexota bacterium]
MLNFSLGAGAVWLDFLNTLGIVDGAYVDQIDTPAAFEAWLRVVGVTLPSEPAFDAASFGAVHEFREILRAAAEAVSRGAPIDEGALDAINTLLGVRVTHERLTRADDGGYRMASARTIASPMHRLIPIAESAVAVLCHPEQLSRVKKCANPECIHYFLDTSKNRTRRWCDMSTCGNRSKAAAYYRRKTAT